MTISFFFQFSLDSSQMVGPSGVEKLCIDMEVQPEDVSLTTIHVSRNKISFRKERKGKDIYSHLSITSWLILYTHLMETSSISHC